MNAALKAAADALGLATPTLDQGKAMEAATLFALAAAFDAAGATVEVRDHTGAAASGFILRGNPGHIPSVTAAGPRPFYFHVSRGNEAIELHNSVEYRGSSGVDHEMDVSAMPAGEADTVRISGGGSFPWDPIVGVELKAFGAGKALPKNAIRAFFGLVVDLIPTWPMQAITFNSGNRSRVFMAGRPRGAFWLLTTGALSAPAKAFGHAHELQIEDAVDDGLFNTAISAMHDHARQWI